MGCDATPQPLNFSTPKSPVNKKATRIIKIRIAFPGFAGILSFIYIELFLS